MSKKVKIYTVLELVNIYNCEPYTSGAIPHSVVIANMDKKDIIDYFVGSQPDKKFIISNIDYLWLGIGDTFNNVISFVDKELTIWVVKSSFDSIKSSYGIVDSDHILFHEYFINIKYVDYKKIRQVDNTIKNNEERRLKKYLKLFKRFFTHT